MSSNKDNFVLISGTTHPELTRELSDILELPITPIITSKFSCGEIYAHLDATIRGKEVFLVQTCTHSVNEDYMETFILLDTLRRSFAHKIHLILPHFGYARQDRQAKIREPISAKLFSNLLGKAGADHVIAVNLHSDQIQGFFDVVTDNLSTRKLFAKYFLDKKLKDVVIVSPDTGGAKAAEKFAKKMDSPLAILHKTRPRHNESEVSHVIGDIQDKNVIIYDDMIDTAGTICNAKDALVERGAKPDGIYLAATHAVFSGPAVERLKKAQFTEVVVTNTIPLSKEQQFDGLKVLSIAPFLSQVMEAVIEHKSASIYHI